MRVIDHMRHASYQSGIQQAISCLTSVVQLGEEDVAALSRVSTHAHSLSAGQFVEKLDLIASRPIIVLSGWLARVRVGRDGKRQILDAYLPGDILRPNEAIAPHVSGALVALIDARLCLAPASPSDQLLKGLALCQQRDEGRLLRQIYRLGRMTASERVYDWMIETRDRLRAAGLAEGDQFMLPITQDMVADILGLTPVHVNRTLKELRLSGRLTWRLGKVHVAPSVSGAQRTRDLQSITPVDGAGRAHHGDGQSA